MSAKEKAKWYLIEKFLQAKKLVQEFPEIFGIPTLFLVVVYSPKLFHSVDSTAATWDIGVLQTPIVAGVIVLMINIMAFLGFKLNFPTLYEEYLNLKFSKLLQWQKYLACWLPILFYSLEFIIVMFLLT